MHLEAKKINGHRYWYLVRKGRKNGVPTNVETIYLGKPERIAKMLGLASDADADDFPVGGRSREIGASAALVQEVEALDLVSLVDEVLGPRRVDASLSFGQLLVCLAIQRSVAPRAQKSVEQLREWFEGSGIRDFLSLRSSGLDARRVHEALSRLRAADIEKLGTRITERVLSVHDISLESLTFDATNFDSYAAPGTHSLLLRRGNAKSKRKNLRILGLGLLVSADGAIPLLSFPYPGNKPDVKSFKSFLLRLKGRRDSLPIGSGSTIAFDGGNVSKEVVSRLAEQSLHFVARLPVRHAPEAAALPTDSLEPLTGKLALEVRAKKVKTKVYGVERTVVAVFSESMRSSQVPGIQRDVKRTRRELEKLQTRLERQRSGNGRGKPLIQATALHKAQAALEREHMEELFTVRVHGSDEAPELDWEYSEDVWQDLHDNRLGRTLILTSRDMWSARRIVETLREQSHVEDAFRQMKDPEWVSTLPLRHYRDPMLRVHSFVSVLALTLAALLVRRLKKAGMSIPISRALHELSELRATRLRYGPSAPPHLKIIAKRFEVPPDPTPNQKKIIKHLKLAPKLGLGATGRKLRSRARAGLRRIPGPESGDSG